MNAVRRLTLLGIATVACVATAFPSFAGPVSKTLDATAVKDLCSQPPIEFAVVGVSRDFDDPAWRDQLVADGIRQLLVDEYKADARFANLEDNPEIRDAVKNLVAATWFGKDPPAATPLHQDDATAKKLLISAHLVNLSKRRVSSFGFGMGAAETTISVTVALDLSVDGRTIMQTSGTGSAKTAQNAVVFQISSDHIAFDATTVGAAVREAVHVAVGESLKAFGA